MNQANRFCGAPTYSGTWFRTMSRPRISEGENRGLTKARMTMSTRKMVAANLRSRKSPLRITRRIARNMSTKRIPAAARISRSLRTGIAYPSFCSPNWMNRRHACQHLSYFQLRVFPSAIQAMAWASRRTRVSAPFASTIQSTYSRRPDGLKPSKVALAFAFRFKAAARSGGTFASGLGAFLATRGAFSPPRSGPPRP